MRKTTTLLLGLLMLATVAMAQQPQIRMPRPSPKASVMQTIGATDMTITYSRPGVKGRQIWGDLVPYDKVWRTGANEATTISFSDDVSINGQKLPKGTYSLHTIPGKDEWTIIFNSVADQWGSYSYDAAKDVVRVKAKPEKDEFREWLSFDVPKVSADEATVAIRWENVSVPFTVNADTTNRTLAQLRTAMSTAAADDWRTSYMAASFAFDNKAPVSNEQLSQWLDQSLKANQNINNLWLKARMQAAAGDRVAAMKTAEEAIAKATPEQKDFAAEIRRQADAWRK